MLKYLLVGFGLLFAPTVFAQCAPGIPGAGNPGCIPPNAPNSPYNQGGNAPATAPAPKWQDSWGAVAMDNVTGQAGVAQNETSKSAAEQAALSQCGNSGGSHCEIITSYYNQCVAVAQQQGGGFLIAATEPTQDKADRHALDKCSSKGSCSIVYKACSEAMRAQQ